VTDGPGGGPEEPGEGDSGTPAEPDAGTATESDAGPQTERETSTSTARETSTSTGSDDGRPIDGGPADSTRHTTSEPGVSGRAAAAVLAVLAVVPLFVVDAGLTYRARLLVLVLVFAVLTMALNVVFAHTDQLFLFVGALAGISAYATALLADALDVTAWLTLPVGALLAGTVGLVASYVAARRGMTVIVIAILTLALQLAAMEFFVGAREITGGSTGFTFTGLRVPFLEEALGLSHHLANYYVLLVLLAGAVLLYRRLMRSKYGLAFDAIRQDEVAAESIGVDVIRYKTVAGFTGAAMIGLVGPIYANAERYIAPSMFAFEAVDVLVLIMLVLGGMRTTLGPIVGAAFVILLNQYLGAFGQWRTAIYGALLVGLFLYFREGVVPKVREVRDAPDGERAPDVLDRFR
jgi:branched-chain amino acid transport system permease protein